MHAFRPLALIILRIAAKFCRCGLNSAVNTRVTAYIIARACTHDFSKCASDDISIFRRSHRTDRNKNYLICGKKGSAAVSARDRNANIPNSPDCPLSYDLYESRISLYNRDGAPVTPLMRADEKQNASEQREELNRKVLILRNYISDL